MVASTVAENKRNAILGAAVADAASLGLHWLYDQDRIRNLAPTNPEFRNPDAADYADVPGYFAHGLKSAGDFSQYGEQHVTMLASLNRSNGIYNKLDYEKAFVECFGYGGTYTGYIDHPTRDTLNHIIFAESNALEQAENLAFNGPDDLKRKLMTKVLGNTKQYSGQELKQKVEASVRLTDNEDHLVEHALKIVALWESVQGYHGADDTQLPALSKLPALVAAYAQKNELSKLVESAVRVTNNNDTAVQFAQCSAKMIEAAIVTGDTDEVIATAKNHPEKLTSSLVDQALQSISESTPSVTAQWGMACQLKIGFPSAVHNIAKSHSFTQAIQQNIYAGGDSCGRAILLGAVMGACHGVGGDLGIPESWIEKLTNANDLIDATHQLVTG